MDKKAIEIYVKKIKVGDYMPKLPFFSVVMPVYNVEKYLLKAIESVVKQTFEEFELILINDCSTDNSLKICNSACDKYHDHIKVITLDKNSGLSNARNIGINSALGEYILFLDSDDWWELNLLESVYKTITNARANIDLVFWGYTEEYFYKNDKWLNNKEIIPQKDILNNKYEILKKSIDIQSQNNDLYAWVANKAYKLSLLKKNLYFNNIPLSEDLDFMNKIFNKINTMIILNASLLHYRRREVGSLRSRYQSKFYEIHKEILLYRYNQIEKNGLLEYAGVLLKEQYLKIVFLNLQMTFSRNSNKNFDARKSFIITAYNDELWKKIDTIKQSPKLNLKFKIMDYFFREKQYLCSIFLGFLIYNIRMYSFYLWCKLR